ncbi:MAG: TonB-dependent receptor [Acidobacteria bacterium]|nr:TonB-dependent receptor [Acidobacteriota bacterium]
MKRNVLESSLLAILISLWFYTPPAFSAIVQTQNANISGVVRNQQNIAVGDAKILVYDEKETLLTSTKTDKEGFFKIDNLVLGNYKLIIQHPSYREYNSSLLFTEVSKDSLEFVLTATELSEGLSITAVLDPEQEAFDASQQIELASKRELTSRPGLLLPQLLQEEAGVRPILGSTFYGQTIIRGLTGQRVVTLLDGVRFNTSTFTAGLEPPVGLIDASIARQVELIYGPGSALYGSDALGGTVNLISEKPRFFKKPWEFHGEMSTFFSSANAASGGDLKLVAGNKRISLLFSGFGKRINDLRAGGGLDSHSVATRYFGLSSKLLGDRMQDTGYLHYGGTGKIVYKIDESQLLSLFYQHTTERNTRVYFLLNGGIGIQESDFSPQVLDFFYTRYEKENLSIFDSLTGTFSFNRQRQQFNVKPDLSDLSTDEYRLARAFGYTLQATTHIGSYQFLTLGAEIYDERITNRRFIFLPPSNQGIPIPGTVPNGTKYSSYGVYLQDTVELLPGKLRLNGGLRYSAFFYKTDSRKNVLDFSGNPSVKDLSIRNDDLTFNLEGVVFIKQRLNLIANISRGFRSPNVIDFGSVGSLPSGFEVQTSDAEALGGFVGTTIGGDAISTGRKVTKLEPESLLNFELGVKYRSKFLSASATFFNSNINDFITQRALILPQGAVGKILSGLPIISQDPNGTVRIPIDGRPVIVKSNIGNIRLYGMETNAQIKISNSLTLSGNFSYLRGKDKNPTPLGKASPSQPQILKKSADIPEIEGGLPPAAGFISLLYQPKNKTFWVEAYSNMSSFQDRLSSLDLADLRIGASRSRNAIAAFFFGGGRNRNLTGNGQDNLAGTSDDILLATGETLQQVQDRVLGVGITNAPLFTSTPGYATFNLRGGFQLSQRSNITIIMENILDKNYRQHGSGVDGAGVNLVVRYSWQF